MPATADRRKILIATGAALVSVGAAALDLSAAEGKKEEAEILSVMMLYLLVIISRNPNICTLNRLFK